MKGKTFTSKYKAKIAIEALKVRNREPNSIQIRCLSELGKCVEKAVAVGIKRYLQQGTETTS